MEELEKFLKEVEEEYELISCIDGQRIDIEINYNPKWNTERFNEILKSKNLNYRLELGRMVVTN